MPSDINHLRSLLGGLIYYRRLLPDMARRIRTITALLKKGATFHFTSTMEDTVRALIAELAAPPILVFPDWDTVTDKSRPFRLHCNANTAGVGATLNSPHCLHHASDSRQRAKLDPSGTRRRMYRLEHSPPETLLVWRILSDLHRPRVRSTDPYNRRNQTTHTTLDGVPFGLQLQLILLPWQ